MLEHDENVCPRCGKPAGDHRLWPSCGFYLAPLPENRTEADRDARDPRLAPAGEPRETFAWGEPRGVEINDVTEQVSAEPSADLAPGVSSEPPSAERPTVEMTVVRLEAVETPTVVERDASDTTETFASEPRETFAWGDASSVELNGLRDHVPGEPSGAPVSESHSGPSPAEHTTPDVAPLRLAAVENPTEVERAPGEADDPASEEPQRPLWWEQASAVGLTGFGEESPSEPSLNRAYAIDRDVPPAEDAADAVTAGLDALENPTGTDREPGDAADAPAAVESTGADEEIPAEQPPAPESDVYSDRSPADRVTLDVDPVPLRSNSQPSVEHERSRPVVAVRTARRSRSQRVAVVCLAAVIALVAVLTGRQLRRHL